MTIPDGWSRGKFPARNPFTESSPWPSADVNDLNAPARATAQRVETERNLFQEAHDRLGGDLRRLAGQ
jgi:hypothetical protein